MSVEKPDRFEQLQHDHLHLNRLVEELRGSLQACLRGEADPAELFSEVEEFVAAAADELFEHFDAEESAFYYVRVLEIPTPRWILYDKVRLGAKLPEGAELIHQERAYTSPIWYTP